MLVSTPNQAPHNLDLVIDFVNTVEFETAVDELETRDGLAAWLTERKLSDDRRISVTDAQRERALRLREALRGLMLSHNGVEADAHAGRELERVAREGQLAVHFTPDAQARLAPRATGFPGALAKLLVPVVEAEADGSWHRVKACRAEDCQWAFYDQSRNRAGVWCDMAVCGNRTKVRAYRRRQPRGG